LWIGRRVANIVAFLLVWLLLFRHLVALLFILLPLLGSSRHLTFAVRLSAFMMVLVTIYGFDLAATPQTFDII
jgi:hypothetical protein